MTIMLSDELKKNFSVFIEKSEKFERYNQWISDSFSEVYLRKSRRYIDGEFIFCLDIATISVDEEHRGKGIAKEIIRQFHIMNPFECTFIENVMYDWFCDSIIKMDFKEMGNDPYLPKSYYKNKEEKNDD